MLIESYRSMVQKWYYNRREAAENMKHEITDWVADKVAKRKIKSATWNVNGINQYRYQVYDGRYNREINLTNQSCECCKWQLSGIPCGHVLAVTTFLGLTDCVQFVEDWFKKPKYQATYAESVHFVGEFHEWVFPEHIHPIIPPRMDNPQPGRPKNTDRISSQGEEPRIINCGRCGEAGHKGYQCKKSFVPDPPSNKRKTKNKQFSVYEHHETPPSFNPSQPYDHSFQSYNPYQSQTYHQNPYLSQTYHQNSYPSQTYNQNPYPSQTYDQNQSQSQIYHQNPYPSQPIHEQNDHQYPFQMFEQYDSQQYASQHLDDKNTQDETSWRNFLGF